ncbi:MAG: phosphoserine phosphatase SerB [Casimicrobiaceae bacterium]
MATPDRSSELPSGMAADLVVQAPEIGTAEIKALARLTRASEIVAVPAGAATQAFRLVLPQEREGIAAYCAAAGFDFGVVPRDQRLDRVRLVAMDMDSTLITIECIDEIADLRGIKPQVAAITARAMRGEIDFRESLRQRVGLLAGLEVDAMQRVYDERLRLSPGAERMLAGFKRAGAQTLLVSGGFTFFTDRLKARLGLDHVLANTLEIANGKLTGGIAGDIVDADAKAAEVQRIGSALAGAAGVIAALGDGANDLPMLARADISFAYRAKPVVRAKTTYSIDYCGLDAALNFFV